MKNFLILGNIIAAGYKDIFPLFKTQKMRIGYKNTRTTKFLLPNGEYASTSSSVYFTNFPVQKDYIELSDEIPTEKFDNYDAVNVNSVKKIPKDYHGVIGVPLNFLVKWNEDQFKIVGCLHTRWNPDVYDFGFPFVDGKMKFIRILIQRNDNEKH